MLCGDGAPSRRQWKAAPGAYALLLGGVVGLGAPVGCTCIFVLHELIALRSTAVGAEPAVFCDADAERRSRGVRGVWGVREVRGGPAGFAKGADTVGEGA